VCERERERGEREREREREKERERERERERDTTLSASISWRYIEYTLAGKKNVVYLFDGCTCISDVYIIYNRYIHNIQ